MKWRNRVAILSRKPKFEGNIIQQHEWNVENSLGIEKKENNLTSDLGRDHAVVGPGNQKYYVFVRSSSDTFTCLPPGSLMPVPMFNAVDGVFKSDDEQQINKENGSTVERNTMGYLTRKSVPVIDGTVCMPGKSNLRKKGSTVEQGVSGFHPRKSVPSVNATGCESIEVSAVECPEKDTMVDEATIHICDIQSDYSNNIYTKNHILHNQFHGDSKPWAQMPNGFTLQAQGSIDDTFQCIVKKEEPLDGSYDDFQCIVKKEVPLDGSYDEDCNKLLEVHNEYSDEKDCGRLPYRLRTELPLGQMKVWSCESVDPLNQEKEVMAQDSLISHLENPNKKVISDIRECSGEDMLNQSFEMLYMLFQDENQNCVYERADKICEEKAESLHQGGEMRTQEAVAVHPETHPVHDMCQLESPCDLSDSPQLLNEIGLLPDFTVDHGYEIDH